MDEGCMLTHRNVLHTLVVHTIWFDAMLCRSLQPARGNGAHYRKRRWARA